MGAVMVHTRSHRRFLRRPSRKRKEKETVAVECQAESMGGVRGKSNTISNISNRADHFRPGIISKYLLPNDPMFYPSPFHRSCTTPAD